jgi:predicted Zn-dependent protease
MAVAMSSDVSTAVTRAQADIEAGRLWKARDRLSAAVRDSPTDQEIIELLGEVHFRMGDGPAAWRYWALTARQGPDAEAAEDAFGERYARAGLADQLSLIPARAPIGNYPNGARERLLALEERARAADISWPRVQSDDQAKRYDEDEDLEGGCFGATVIGVLLVGPWLLGLVAALYLLGRFGLGIF